MVEGTVLKIEYAQMVGADFFSINARESVRIANNFFGYNN
jgi:methanogenic corrinoid protein MtbC1